MHGQANAHVHKLLATGFRGFWNATFAAFRGRTGTAVLCGLP